MYTLGRSVGCCCAPSAFPLSRCPGARRSRSGSAEKKEKRIIEARPQMTHQYSAVVAACCCYKRWLAAICPSGERFLFFFLGNFLFCIKLTQKFLRLPFSIIPAAIEREWNMRIYRYARPADNICKRSNAFHNRKYLENIHTRKGIEPEREFNIRCAPVADRVLLWSYFGFSFQNCHSLPMCAAHK